MCEFFMKNIVLQASRDNPAHKIWVCAFNGARFDNFIMMRYISRILPNIQIFGTYTNARFIKSENI